MKEDEFKKLKEEEKIKEYSRQKRGAKALAAIMLIYIFVLIICLFIIVNTSIKVNENNIDTIDRFAEAICESHNKEFLYRIGTIGSKRGDLIVCSEQPNYKEIQFFIPKNS